MTTRTKKVRHIKTKEVTDEVAPVKVKKAFDFEVGDPIIPEKIDDVEGAEETEDTEEAEADTPSLDDDELNPFKDKWEE